VDVAGLADAAAAATKTAARPTSEWKAATSCGMAVMAMRRAMTVPTPPPRASPIRIIRVALMLAGGMAKSVVAMAIAMPTMPSMLPRRDVAGCDRPFSARMKRAPERR
jgi:hypothetical protein